MIRTQWAYPYLALPSNMKNQKVPVQNALAYSVWTLATKKKMFIFLIFESTTLMNYWSGSSSRYEKLKLFSICKHPSLIFAVRARSLPLKWSYSWVCSDLVCNHNSKVTNRDKPSAYFEKYSPHSIYPGLKDKAGAFPRGVPYRILPQGLAPGAIFTTLHFMGTIR